MTYAGISPKGPNDYTGPKLYGVTIVTRNREPSGADYRQPENGKLYPIGSWWIISIDPTSGVQGDLWYLSKIVANVAYWVKVSGGSAGPLIEIEVDSDTAPGVNPVTPDGTGLITFNGNIVAPHSVPIETNTTALNEMSVDLQISSTSATTDATKNGVAHFDSSSFTVDSNGFVTLSGGGGPAIDSINVDANTAPGTDPVVSNGSGQITMTGAQVAAGVIGANAIRTDSLAVNSLTIEIQRAAASASSSVNNNGIASFNSTDFNVDSNAYVSLIPPSSSQTSNLGIAYSAGTFTVQGYDGTALSTSNPAIVWLQDKTNPGRLKKYIVTANQTFTDGSAGTIDNMRWNLTTGVNASEDIPFYLYAVGNDAQNAISFMISRVPHAATSPVAASIGKSGAIVNTGQGDFFSLANITVADYESNPCIVLGSFRMQFTGATDSWTVQALTTEDGIGEFHESTIFIMPRGQFGAASGKYFLDNGGTAPDDSGAVYKYLISKNGRVALYGVFNSMDTGGVGAVEAQVALPFTRAVGQVFVYGFWVGAGGSPASAVTNANNPSLLYNTFIQFPYSGGVIISDTIKNADLGVTARLDWRTDIEISVS